MVRFTGRLNERFNTTQISQDRESRESLTSKWRTIEVHVFVKLLHFLDYAALGERKIQLIFYNVFKIKRRWKEDQTCLSRLR